MQSKRRKGRQEAVLVVHGDLVMQRRCPPPALRVGAHCCIRRLVLHGHLCIAKRFVLFMPAHPLRNALRSLSGNAISQWRECNGGVMLSVCERVRALIRDVMHRVTEWTAAILENRIATTPAHYGYFSR